jgi:Polysaccharide biosynthesis enzyme WcbI
MHVYVHGNCQGPALAGLLSERFPEWQITSYEVFGQKIIDEVDRFHSLVKNADIVISQPVHDGYRGRQDLSLNWIRAAANPSAALIVIPSMFFDGQLIGCRSIKVPAYGMDYHDALLLHLFAAEIEQARLHEILLSEDLYSWDFIQREMDLSLSEMRRREAADGVDVPLSPFVEKYYLTMQLFHVINHPCRPALAYVANEICAHLGYSGGISAAGKECLPFPHVPFHPSVARFIRHQEGKPTGWDFGDLDLYHLPSERLAPADYLSKAIEHLNKYAKNDLRDYLKERPHVRSFLERVAVSMPSLPGIKIWALSTC